MFRNNRLFVSFMLVFALLAQPLAAMAQDKTLKSGGANSPVAQNGASVNITRVRPVGADVVDVTWDVVIPTGVEVQGFDVRVDAGLSNGTAQTDSKSFGGNARSGSFKFNLPLASNGGPKPGGGSGGIIGPANNGGNVGVAPKEIAQKEAAPKVKVVETKSADKTPRKFGEGNISGGNNNNGANNNNNGGNGNGTRPVRPIPTPTPKLNPPVPNPTPFPRPTPPAKPEPVRITKLQAFITAKFATGNDLAAFREFIQPTDKTTGELTPRSGRGSSLQVKKLVHLNEVARLATECPAGQECFDIIAESRDANAAAQLKVSMEVVFGNGLRKTATRTTGNLARPIRLSVDKVSGQQVSTVLVNINGGGNREQFTKTDTQGVAILPPTIPSKK